MGLWLYLMTENLEFFLNLCLVLKQCSNIYFCNYHSFIILENIMENTGTICTQVAGRSLPRSNNHGRGHPQENVLLGRMGERSGHQRQCYNCGKSGHLANVCPSKYKVAKKTDIKEERKIIQTANISNSTL